MATIERAIQIAAKAHEGQKDRAGQPYLLHPLRIMMQMDTLEKMIIAALHDVVEDSQWTLDDLQQEGFSETVVDAVDALSKREGEGYDAYIERVKLNPTAIPIKLGDLQDNADIMRLNRLTENDWERLNRYHRAYIQLKSVSE